MYTHVVILLIENCQLFIIFVCDETHHNSFGSGLTYFNEVHKHIVLYLVIYMYLIQMVIQYTLARGSMVQLTNSNKARTRL